MGHHLGMRALRSWTHLSAIHSELVWVQIHVLDPHSIKCQAQLKQNWQPGLSWLLCWKQTRLFTVSLATSASCIHIINKYMTRGREIKCTYNSIPLSAPAAYAVATGRALMGGKKTGETGKCKHGCFSSLCCISELTQKESWMFPTSRRRSKLLTLLTMKARLQMCRQLLQMLGPAHRRI